jgi:hypothetical protein
MRFTVGGRVLELTKEQVERAVRGVPGELYRTYYVEINGVRYPTKQAIAVVTGWTRETFTSHEANRVLNRLGFKCVNTDYPNDDFDVPMNGPERGDDAGADILESLEVLTAAVAGLSRRVSALEESVGIGAI